MASCRRAQRVSQYNVVACLREHLRAKEARLFLTAKISLVRSPVTKYWRTARSSFNTSCHTHENRISQLGFQQRGGAWPPSGDSVQHSAPYTRPQGGRRVCARTMSCSVVSESFSPPVGPTRPSGASGNAVATPLPSVSVSVTAAAAVTPLSCSSPRRVARLCALPRPRSETSMLGALLWVVAANSNASHLAHPCQPHSRSRLRSHGKRWKAHLQLLASHTTRVVARVLPGVLRLDGVHAVCRTALLQLEAPSIAIASRVRVLTLELDTDWALQ